MCPSACPEQTAFALTPRLLTHGLDKSVPEAPQCAILAHAQADQGRSTSSVLTTGPLTVGPTLHLVLLFSQGSQRGRCDIEARLH